MQGLKRKSMVKTVDLIEKAQFDYSSTVPKLFIFGTDDSVVVSDKTDEVLKKFGPNAEVVMIEGGGHFGKREAHVVAVQRFADFITRHK